MMDLSDDFSLVDFRSIYLFQLWYRDQETSGLVTKTGGTLCSQFKSKIPNLSPLDRIALTANGNLQRIFSSYYDAPVHVFVLLPEFLDFLPNLKDLHLDGQTIKRNTWYSHREPYENTPKDILLNIFQQNFNILK